MRRKDKGEGGEGAEGHTEIERRKGERKGGGKREGTERQ